MTARDKNETHRKTSSDMKSRDTIPGTTPRLTESDIEQTEGFDLFAQLAHESAPSDSLWGRIDAAIDAEQAAPGIAAIRANDGNWQARPEGVWKKVISTRPDGVQMYLVRCEPGARIPAHYHKSVEQVFVLEGEFSMDGTSFGPGDGQLAAANTEHPDIFSEHGCLLLIVA